MKRKIKGRIKNWWNWMLIKHGNIIPVIHNLSDVIFIRWFKHEWLIKK